jgi:23S rRNA U2552 (ribose-2'-O)-methylase RlmE/FtsJ
MDMAGMKWTETKDIGVVFKEYYQQLFTAEGVEGIEDCVACVSERISLALNESLSVEFVAEEIVRALAQMHPLKSLRHDGFGVSFFQQHWGIIGDKVRMVILDFLNGGSFDPVINETFIMLIPKTPTTSSVGEYRPISLCNVLYKLIAKVLANRLKTVLPSIISHNQSAFVSGRLIMDSATFHAYTHEKQKRLYGSEVGHAEGL